MKVEESLAVEKAEFTDIQTKPADADSEQSAPGDLDWADANSLRRVFLQNSEFVRLQFEIEDTGPGIAAEEMNKLFEPFEQTKTGHKSHQGTGLGLPISRKFVQMMGGDITVSSTPDVGSKFAFDIQIRLAEPNDVKMLKPQKKVIGLAPDQPEYRILVVDDRADNRLVLVRLLSSIEI